MLTKIGGMSSMHQENYTNKQLEIQVTTLEPTVPVDKYFPDTTNDDQQALRELITRYEENRQGLLLTNIDLTRKVVSFQANKSTPIYRLFKYKEGFSAILVEYLIDTFNITGPILDPFSGTGTSSIVAGSRNIPSMGIELLPVGHLVAKARSLFLNGISATSRMTLLKWRDGRPWERIENPIELITMPITNGAYSVETEWKIRQYITEARKQEHEAETLLLFALCSILESISYTRKDGQCLRWDYRSGRSAGKRPFDKGLVLTFEDAVREKLSDIIVDITDSQRKTLFRSSENDVAIPEFILGSSLFEMLSIEDNRFDAVITSPPYCNRYDYTRIYALELAALGVSKQELNDMRQTMLSCTVENRQKDLLSTNSKWADVLSYTLNHEALDKILKYLWDLRSSGKLNNNGIPRMIEGYFSEMACIIYECYRLLRKAGVVAMVNDNVQYAGISIPVDMILSDIAQCCGFTVEKIMVLPQGKGNSSQQMGTHGRIPLRKCVYIWTK